MARFGRYAAGTRAMGADSPRSKRVLNIFLHGGGSQLEPGFKPNTDTGGRSARFRRRSPAFISTSAAVHRPAERKLAIVRSLDTKNATTAAAKTK
jgi:hypothetical protein